MRRLLDIALAMAVSILGGCQIVTGPSKSAEALETSTGSDGMDLPAESTTADASSSDGEPGTTSDSPSDEDPGPCCQASAVGGCSDPDVESCVCAVDRFCCEGVWDEVCADAVEALGCGSCGGPPPRPKNDCCDSSTRPGCIDPEVASCLCQHDPYCCESAWDDLCVDLLSSTGCGSCSAGVNETGMGCCSPHEDAGCNDAPVEACVCAHYPACCETEWDAVCADAVVTLGCAMCQLAGDGCCEPHDAAGCSDPEVAACVCGQDPYCCQVAWDASCVQQVADYGCGPCVNDDTGTTGGTETGTGP